MIDTTYSNDENEYMLAYYTGIFHGDLPDVITIPLDIEGEIKRQSNLKANGVFYKTDTSNRFQDEEKAYRRWKRTTQLYNQLRKLAADYEKERAVCQAELDTLKQI
jgi:hypothetical protein